MDTAILPGGDQAKVRVIGTDGFHNARADSNGIFSVSDNTPKVIITSPENGARVMFGTYVNFEGDAFDTEDDEIPADSFFWEMDDTIIGTGRQALAKLPYGSHQITLYVVDSGKNIGQATIELNIGALFLPLVIR